MDLNLLTISWEYYLDGPFSNVSLFVFVQKFEAYDSNGAVVAGDKNKEVFPK